MRTERGMEEACKKRGTGVKLQTMGEKVDIVRKNVLEREKK